MTGGEVNYYKPNSQPATTERFFESSYVCIYAYKNVNIVNTYTFLYMYSLYILLINNVLNIHLLCHTDRLRKIR